MSKMYLTIGIPGSGKSTYIKKHLKENEIIISKDDIKYKKYGNKGFLYSKEEEIYQEILSQINQAIEENKDFYIDQTFLSKKTKF